MKIIYFAWIRERVGKAEEELAPPASVGTVADHTAGHRPVRRRGQIPPTHVDDGVDVATTGGGGIRRQAFLDVAERVAIDSYTHVIRWLGEHDATTRRVVEDILAVEEGHADELANMLAAA